MADIIQFPPMASQDVKDCFVLIKAWMAITDKHAKDGLIAFACQLASEAEKGPTQRHAVGFGDLHGRSQRPTAPILHIVPSEPRN